MLLDYQQAALAQSDLLEKSSSGWVSKIIFIGPDWNFSSLPQPFNWQFCNGDFLSFIPTNLSKAVGFKLKAY